MQRSKIIAISLFSFMGLLVVAGVVMICVLLSTLAEKVNYDYSGLYVSQAESDTLTFEEQIQTEEKLLVIFTSPQCVFCAMEFNTLKNVEVSNLTLDIVSPASQGENGEHLKDIPLEKFKEVKYVHDVDLSWCKRFEVLGFPVTLYFENGELQWKRSGLVKLNEVLKDK